MAILHQYSEETDESTRLLGNNTHDSRNVEIEVNGRPLKASKGRKCMVMLAGLVQQCVSVGLGYGLSVMYAELLSVFNELRSKAALIQGIYLGLICGTGIVLTGLIKRIGPGPTIILGSIISCAGFFASAFAENLTTIILLAGAISGIGMSTCYLGAFISVSWMFHEDPGFPLVFVTIGSSIGQFIVPLLYELFISMYSWSGGFILVSGIALQCVPIGVIVYTSRRYYVTNDVTVPTNKSESRSILSVYVTLLKDPLVWILLFDFFLVSLTGSIEAWFIVDIMTSRGFTRESGSILASTVGFANFLGRIISSCLRFKCTRVSTVYHWLWLSPLIAGAHALVINLTDYWALFVACLIQGTTFGICNAHTPAIIFEVSGHERYPQAMSMVNLMYGLGDLFGNLLGGYIRDVFGVYDNVFYMAVAASLWVWLNSFVASWIIHTRKKKKEKAETEQYNQQRYEVLS